MIKKLAPPSVYSSRPIRPRSFSRSFGLFGMVGCCLLAIAGCKEEQIQSYDVPKSPASPTAPGPSVSTNEPSGPPTVAAEKPAEPPKPSEPAQPSEPAKPSEPPATGGPVQIGAMKAVVPAGWVQDLKPRMMREATFLVGPAEKRTEVIITRLNGPSGELLSNINRWRAQVGLPPVESVNAADFPKVKLSGGDATLYDFAGPDAKAPVKRLIQLESPRPEGGAYFVKIIGDAAVVAEQKAAFDQFVASIEIGK